MKFSLSVLTSSLAAVAASESGLLVTDSSSSSQRMMNIMAHARRLEQNNDQEVDLSWVSGYSLKFQGCHHVQQWNGEADEEQDVRLATKRLARFRLCPAETCSARKASGCKEGFGDYIVDLGTFLSSYYEVSRQNTEYKCQTYLNYNCNCDDDDGKGDDFNAEYCEYDCFANADLFECIDKNPYEGDQEEQEEAFDVEEYLECKEFQPNNNNRRLNENGGEAQLFIGPYCAEQGGAVLLGVFKDDACTEFADDLNGRYTYEYLTRGEVLPYSSVSIIGSECTSCLDHGDENESQDNNKDGVSEACEAIYQTAGKCELQLSSRAVQTKNTNACNYLEGIKMIRQDGIITALPRASATATAFIVIFALLTAVLAFYVYYLHLRLNMKKKENSLL